MINKRVKKFIKRKEGGGLFFQIALSKWFKNKS